jgi:hypothetical protein
MLTWSLTLRVEHGMRMLRGIFLRKGEEASGCNRKVHHEELHG